MACDIDVVLAVLVVLVVRDGDVVLAVLVARDGGALHGGVLPLVAPHCYKSTRYTRNILSSTSCS